MSALAPTPTGARGELLGSAKSGLPLPVHVVAYVGVAIGGIIPQARVKWKRVIKLVDPLARVVDGRRNVRSRRWLGQRQRGRALNWRDVRAAAASRAEAGALRALG